MKVKRYVIYQKSSWWTCGGYYTGKKYQYDNEDYGAFESDIKLAKKYKSKKVAENVVKKIHYFANGLADACFVDSIEIEVEENE